MFAGHQSPINVITANVVQNPRLAAIKFSNNWKLASAHGYFNNTGHNVQFTLDSSSPTVTTTFSNGQYQLKQMHMHWGKTTGTGSEHRFDGDQTEVEIHFVHTRMTTAGTTSQNGFAVIAVFAEVSRTSVSGFWAKLDPSRVPHANKDGFKVSNFKLSDVLPSHLNNYDYYHYDGSLTTPECTEAVQWYLIGERIKVPAAYLTSLRSIKDDAGKVLDANYRQIQALNSRKVDTPAICGKSLSKC